MMPRLIRRTLAEVKVDARQEAGYLRADKVLARKVAAALGLDWSPIEEKFHKAYAGPRGCRSYFDAIDQAYPDAPVRIEWSGLRLDRDFFESIHCGDFRRTFAFRQFVDARDNQWTDDGRPVRPVAAILRRHSASRPGRAVVHDLPPRSGKFSGHAESVGKGFVYCQSFDAFLVELAAAARTVDDGTAIGELVSWIQGQLKVGAYIEGLSVDSGGRCIGRVYRGRLQLRRDAMPANLTACRFLRRLATEQVVKQVVDRSRQTYWERARIDGVDGVAVLRLADTVLALLNPVADSERESISDDDFDLDGAWE